MFKTLVGASIAALFFSSVSIATVPGITEGDDLVIASVDANDDAIPAVEMFLFAQNEEVDVLPAERLAQVEQDEGVIPAVEMFSVLAQNEEVDVLPIERLAQVQQDDDAISTPEMMLLLCDAEDTVDVLPTNVG